MSVNSLFFIVGWINTSNTTVWVEQLAVLYITLLMQRDTLNQGEV